MLKVYQRSRIETASIQVIEIVASIVGRCMAAAAPTGDHGSRVLGRPIKGSIPTQSITVGC